jgi:hypothetical protein
MALRKDLRGVWRDTTLTPLTPMPMTFFDVQFGLELGAFPEIQCLAEGMLAISDWGGRLFSVDPSSGRVLAQANLRHPTLPSVTR